MSATMSMPVELLPGGVATSDIAVRVHIAMLLHYKPCRGGECDDGERCRRHSVSKRVASRYAALVARWRSL